ncbi:hypothetical protein YSY43_26620 [Paenibacillus sp. YSY-4.3]
MDDSILNANFINDISFDHLHDNKLSLDKWDWIMMVLSGSIGALCDLVIGHPKGMDEPKITNSSFGGLGEQLKQYDLKNNPIDYQEPGAFGGDHRLYSYGHDLFRFFEGVRQTMFGEYAGVSSVGWGELVKEFPEYEQLDFGTAVIVNLLHLFKDFCTVRSLPIPGMTILANLNGDQMPAFAEKLYIDHGFNLRIVTGQALSVAAIEVMLRVYMFLRYFSADVSKEAIRSKRSKMLLFTHSFAMLFNLGKVAVTKNPFLLNVPQLLMIAKYCFQIAKESMDLRKQLITARHLSFAGQERDLLALYDNATMMSGIHSAYEESIQDYADIKDNQSIIVFNNHKIAERIDDVTDSYSEVLRLLERRKGE